MKYLIQPMNEGQDLNYSEIRYFKSDSQAKKHGKKMVMLLAKALAQGTITVVVERY